MAIRRQGRDKSASTRENHCIKISEIEPPPRYGQHSDTASQ